MIGIDALVQQRLMMDFERRLIKVEDASVPEKIRPGDIVVTARRFRGQLILTEVRAAGLPLDAVIDTGVADHDRQSRAARQIAPQEPRQVRHDRR